MLIKAVCFALMVLADRLSKLWAIASLKPIGTYELVENILHLTYVENIGAAFSMLRGKTAFLIVLPVIVCIGLVYLLVSGKVRNKLGSWSLVLILGGAVGNLIDRVLYGAVVDFFEIRLFKFAVFNVADIFVTVGAALLFVYILFFSEEKNDGNKTDKGE